jgi:hypothetical protein
LLANYLLHKAVVDGFDDLIDSIDAKGLRAVTPTYFDGVRTRLSVVTTRGDIPQQQEATRRSYLISSTSRPSSNAESDKLAFRLHENSHLSARDLEEMCRRAGILSPQLAHSLMLAAQFIHVCARQDQNPARNFYSRTSKKNLTSPCMSMFSIWTVSTGVPSYMLWIPAKVFLWLDCAKTRTLSCWQVLLSVNGSMFKDPQLRCRVTRSLRKVTFRTCCVATTSLSAKKVHADITKRESLREAMVF